MSIKREIIVPLHSPVEYANKGEQIEAAHVTILAPTSRNLSQCARIKQGFMRAVMDISKQFGSDQKESSDDDASLNASDIISMLYASLSDISPLFLEFKEMLKDIGLLDGEVKMTMPIINLISPEDMENLFGEYLANFTLSSTSLNANKK